VLELVAQHMPETNAAVMLRQPGEREQPWSLSLP
jgi:hypothetical protein